MSPAAYVIMAAIILQVAAATGVRYGYQQYWQWKHQGAYASELWDKDVSRHYDLLQMPPADPGRFANRCLTHDFPGGPQSIAAINPIGSTWKNWAGCDYAHAAFIADRVFAQEVGTYYKCVPRPPQPGSCSSADNFEEAEHGCPLRVTQANGPGPCRVDKP
jgi:hypothetical protein